MRFTVPMWDVASYANDRRAHRHRCKCCRRVIEAGDAALMAKVEAKRTIAVHAECADKKLMPERAATYRDALRESAFAYQLRCFGYSETNPQHYSKIAKLRAEVGAAAKG